PKADMVVKASRKDESSASPPGWKAVIETKLPVLPTTDAEVKPHGPIFDPAYLDGSAPKKRPEPMPGIVIFEPTPEALGTQLTGSPPAPPPLPPLKNQREYAPIVEALQL